MAMEQTITTAIAQARRSLTELSALSQSYDEKVAILKSRYQSYEAFNAAFNPDRQIDFAADQRKTLMEDYSPLSLIDAAYGNGSAASWLTTMLADLNKFSGSKNMDDGQTKALAKMIAQEYGGMKYSVMLLFFFRFKCGDFGKFYGKVDPMVITCALKDFARDCEVKRSRYLREEREHRDLEQRQQLAGMRALWHRFRTALEQRGTDDAQRSLFASLTPLSVNPVSKVLTLEVTREQYDMLEGEYFGLFKSAFTQFYPNYRLMYRLSPAASAEEYVSSNSN